MAKTDKSLDDDGKRALSDVRALCVKIADHAGKGQWWNAMAYAAELVVVCQDGCHSEIERVAQRKRVPAKKRAAKKPTAKTKRR